MMQIEDNEFLYMIHQKDDESLRLFIYRYERIVKGFLHQGMFYAAWMRDRSEVHQISKIILNHAILSYRDDIYSSFRHYFLCLLKNEFIDETRKRNTSYEVISLDTPIYEESGLYMKDCIPNREPRYEADWCIRKEMLDRNIMKWSSSMNYVERQIIRLRFYGFTYQEIADYLNINKKKVDNTMCKIRKNKGMIDYN